MFLHCFDCCLCMIHEAGGRTALQGHSKIVALASSDRFLSIFLWEPGRGTSRAHGHVPVRLKALFPSEFLLHVQLAKLCFPAASLIQTCRSQWKDSHLFQKGPGPRFAVDDFTPEWLPCLVLSLSLCQVLHILGNLFRLKSLQALCSPRLHVCESTLTSCCVQQH